jgi:hypothetical protein
MADEVYAFDENDARRIGRAVRAYEAGSSMPPMPMEQPRQRNYSRIPFRVDATETVPAHGLLRVTGMVDVDGRCVYKTDKPDATYRRQYLVNGPDEITYRSGSTGYGWGTWLWHADYVLYDTGATPAYGETWGPEPSSWTIKKDAPGFLIQGGNTGSGAASRTIAIQEVPQHVFGKADSAIANAASGTVRIYGGTQGSESDTGLTIASCYNYGPDIADEANVWVGWLGGKAYVQNMECV